jgi:hypothetical protein
MQLGGLFQLLQNAALLLSGDFLNTKHSGAPPSGYG